MHLQEIQTDEPKTKFFGGYSESKSSTSDVLIINIEHSIPLNIIVKLIKSSEIICLSRNKIFHNLCISK